MTVDSYAKGTPSKLVCKWFNNNQVLQDTFDENSLQVYTEPPTSSQTEISTLVNQIWKISLEGAEFVENFSHPLTKEGRFEVVIFNSMLFLAASDVIHHDLRQVAMTKYFEFLNTQAIDFDVNPATHDIPKFVNHRLRFYAEEIDKMSEADNLESAYYPPSRVFAAFFKTPLAFDLKEHSNEDEVISFNATLRILRQQLVRITERFWTKL